MKEDTNDMNSLRQQQLKNSPGCLYETGSGTAMGGGLARQMWTGTKTAGSGQPRNISSSVGRILTPEVTVGSWSGSRWSLKRCIAIRQVDDHDSPNLVQAIMP